MAIGEIKDVERCEIVNKVDDLGKPLLKKVVSRDEDEESEINESYLMVLFSTFVAVCGSFEFGSCVSLVFTAICYFSMANYFLRFLKIVSI